MAAPHEQLRRDPILSPLIDEHGELVVEPHPDPFRRLVITVINQQLSTASAAAIRERVFDRIDITPDGVLQADDAVLRDAGLSRQKITYLHNIAGHFSSPDFAPKRLTTLDDEAVIEELTAITGVGVWTAKMYLMFCLGREDVFPVEDLGIRRGMETLFGIDDRDEMDQTATRWQPYRSYASRYLWRTMD